MSESIELKRGNETMAAVEEVSKYIDTLRLPKEQNNELISKLLLLLNTAELEQFEEGLKVGIKAADRKNRYKILR